MPRRAYALATLLAQVDAKFPTRSKASDGWIASAGHLDRTGAGAAASQHNANAADVVCAIDITEDLAVGLDCNLLMEELDRSNDPRIFYLIHDRQIDNSDDTRTPYYGSNPHTKHLHISTPYTRPELYDDARPWALPMLGTAATPVPPPANPAVRPPRLPWHLPAGHWLGNVAGGAKQHGGHPRYDTAQTRALIRNVQQWTIYRGCVRGVPPEAWASSGWADSLWEAATDAAVIEWHRRYYPGQRYPAQVWADDYARLTA